MASEGGKGKKIEGKVVVSRDKYLEILGFATYAYLTEKITPYSGMMGGVRTLGQYIENFIYGKIAEVALQIFLKNNLGLETLTDIDLAGFLEGTYLPDLIAFKHGTEYRPLELWIDAKEVRRDQRWLLIPASAVRSRPYDVYVAVWVGLPDAHVAWLMEHVPEVKSKMSREWKEFMKRHVDEIVENIPCEVMGFATWNDVLLVVQAKEGKKEAEQELDRRFGKNCWHYFPGGEPLFDPEDSSWRGARVGENVGFYLKKLREVSSWSVLHRLILENRRLVGQIPEMPRGLKFPEICGKVKGARDLRAFAQECIKRQLSFMKAKHGSILREKSWFEQPLEY